MLKYKRIYDEFNPAEDGERVLVDRLWPRGVKKQTVHIDRWPKEITPSDNLRKWFHSQTGSFEKFIQFYYEELDASEEAQAICKELAELSKKQPVTLIYAAKNETENHAMVLQAYIERFIS